MGPSFYRNVFPDKRSLITDVLFNKGYKRWRVSILTTTGEQVAGTVWTRKGERLFDFYRAKGAKEVTIEPLDIAPADIWLQDGKYGGDVIVTDDLLEAWEVSVQDA